MDGYLFLGSVCILLAVATVYVATRVNHSLFKSNEELRKANFEQCLIIDTRGKSTTELVDRLHRELTEARDALRESERHGKLLEAALDKARDAKVDLEKGIVQQLRSSGALEGVGHAMKARDDIFAVKVN